MIDTDVPTDWRALQSSVAQMLRESGVTAEVEKEIQTARGPVVVDVWAEDTSGTPPQTYLVECKRWRSPAPKSVVHAFRTVVGDSGAHWGALVASRGFQRGAHEAARYSNVRLLTWPELQNLFEQRWMERHFLPTVAAGVDALVEYTEPVNGRIVRKAQALPSRRRQEFERLHKKYFSLGAFVLMYRAPAGIGPLLGINYPSPPLRATVQRNLTDGIMKLPDSVLDATSLRQLLAVLLHESGEAVEAFDRAFGERA